MTKRVSEELYKVIVLAALITCNKRISLVEQNELGPGLFHFTLTCHTVSLVAHKPVQRVPNRKPQQATTWRNETGTGMTGGREAALTGLKVTSSNKKIYMNYDY